MGGLIDIPSWPLDRIRSVAFYKRDAFTTDLICCDVELHDGLA